MLAHELWGGVRPWGPHRPVLPRTITRSHRDWQALAVFVRQRISHAEEEQDLLRFLDTEFPDAWKEVVGCGV